MEHLPRIYPSQRNLALKMPSLFSLFIDPKGLFAISTLLSLLFVEADESSQTLKLSVPTMDKVIAYFNCQLFLAVLGMLILVLIITAGDIQRNKLTSRELRLAAWFLWSGTVFHVAMDGGGVVFKQPQLLRENYQRMDNRFRSHVPFNRGGPHESEVLGAMTVVLIEIFVQAPMCLVSYVAVMKRLSWRNEMALATLSMYMYCLRCGVVGAVLEEMQVHTCSINEEEVVCLDSICCIVELCGLNELATACFVICSGVGDLELLSYMYIPSITR